MKNKNLDKLFQEKFSDFKETPDNKVWRSIDASLDKEKKKRGIPYWWMFSGVAAALLIGFIIVNPFAENQNTNETIVGSQIKTIKNNGLENNSTNTQSTDKKIITAEELIEKNIIQVADKDKIENKVEKTITPKVTTETTNNKAKQFIATKQEKSLAHKQQTKNTNTSIALNEKTRAEVSSTNTENGISDLKTSESEENATAKDFPFNTQSKVVATEQENEKEALTQLDKRSIFDEIANQEEKITEKKLPNKWSAGPSVAPVYFNALGEGSSVNSIFVANSKSGNVNLSYGVSVAYQISKKLSVRSGIHKVDYGYDTNEVSFSSSISATSNKGQLNTIKYTPTSENIIVTSQRAPKTKFNIANTSSDVTARSSAREGFLSQQLGYLEVPLELNYTLLNTKFGVDLVGGFSSLLLIDNNISLTSGELTTDVGEANNVNDFNFSANMGVGLYYKFAPKIRLNVEPVFKYQLNTFSEVNGNFNPYSVGIYSGLTFKF